VRVEKKENPKKMGIDVAARGVDYAKVVGALADAVKELNKCEGRPEDATAGTTAADGEADGEADRVAAMTTAPIGTHGTARLKFDIAGYVRLRETRSGEAMRMPQKNAIKTKNKKRQTPTLKKRPLPPKENAADEAAWWAVRCADRDTARAKASVYDEPDHRKKDASRAAE
jgi:hypothetical protein